MKGDVPGERVAQPSIELGHDCCDQQSIDPNNLRVLSLPSDGLHFIVLEFTGNSSFPIYQYLVF